MPAMNDNRLLAALPWAVLDHLKPDLKLVSLVLKQVLVDQGDRVDYAYFPTSGMGSLVVVLEDGESVEAASLGRTGMVGLPLVLGDGTSPFQVLIQIAGEGWRMPAEAFLRHQREHQSFHDLALRYAATTLAQTSRQAACNRCHTVQQRLGRWLLQARDLIGSNNFQITQEYIAIMLGVRRPTVSLEATRMQAAGFIRYRRGRISILDQVGLEQVACEDYRVIQADYDRLFGNDALPAPGGGMNTAPAPG
jgi:CRP-like cAMP-binding protein